MKRLLLTDDLTYDFQVPTGRRFGVACSGTFGGATVTVKYNTGMTKTTATGTLTIDGVVIHGETVTIGDDVYCFAADTAQTVGADQIPVDISAATTASAGTLTITAAPTAGDNMTIGPAGDTTVYTFIANESTPVAGEIRIGTDALTARANIVAAINGTTPNTPNPYVSAAAFVGDACVITALVGGAAGDLITTTTDFTEPTNIFDAATLGTTVAGVDCVQADAVTALVAADAGVDYSLADGAGDTVTVTAAIEGPDGNEIGTDAGAMANGAFSTATLTGGTDPIDRYVGFSTTAIAFANAAGEKSGVNYGAHDEIALVVTNSTPGTTNIVAIVNVLED